jgi:DnaK suppressor protein
MDQKEVERFRQLLLKRREEILGASKHNLEAAQEIGKDGVSDFADEGSIASNKTVLVSLSEAEKKHVVEIDDALFRLKNGTYGTCQNCGEPVGEKRLSVKPEAPLCIKCQNGAEGKR